MNTTDALFNHVQIHSCDVYQAIAGEEFYLVFQPIFEIGSGKVDSCEALLRWRHPVLGELLPDAFIPVIESDPELEKKVVKLVLFQLEGARAQLKANGFPIRMSMNISPQLLTPEFTDFVLETVAAIDVMDTHHWLELEIVERGMLNSDGEAIECIRRLQSHKIQIALDDFGVGTSTWEHLGVLEVDHIKIDRKYIAGTITKRGYQLVKAMVAMATTMNIGVVAEGVETELELLKLRSIAAIDYWQGYLGSRPLSLEDLIGFLYREFEGELHRVVHG